MKVGNGPHPLAGGLILTCRQEYNVGSWFFTSKSRNDAWILADCIRAVRERLGGHCVIDWKYGT